LRIGVLKLDIVIEFYLFSSILCHHSGYILLHSTVVTDANEVTLISTVLKALQASDVNAFHMSY